MAHTGRRCNWAWFYLRTERPPGSSPDPCVFGRCAPICPGSWFLRARSTAPVLVIWSRQLRHVASLTNCRIVSELAARVLGSATLTARLCREYRDGSQPCTDWLPDSGLSSLRAPIRAPPCVLVRDFWHPSPNRWHIASAISFTEDPPVARASFRCPLGLAILPYLEITRETTNYRYL